MEIWRRAAGVGMCRTHRGMELCRCAAGVGTSRYAALEACCACRDVEEEEAQSYRTSGDALRALLKRDLELWRRPARVMSARGSELWRCAAAVEKLEIWSSGGTLQALPQKRYGALAYCLLLLDF